MTVIKLSPIQESIISSKIEKYKLMEEDLKHAVLLITGRPFNGFEVKGGELHFNEESPEIKVEEKI